MSSFREYDLWRRSESLDCEFDEELKLRLIEFCLVGIFLGAVSVVSDPARVTVPAGSSILTVSRLTLSDFNLAQLLWLDGLDFFNLSAATALDNKTDNIGPVTASSSPVSTL
jgi:hypothetical protein